MYIFYQILFVCFILTYFNFMWMYEWTKRMKFLQTAIYGEPRQESNCFKIVQNKKHNLNKLWWNSRTRLINLKNEPTRTCQFWQLISLKIEEIINFWKLTIKHFSNFRKNLPYVAIMKSIQINILFSKFLPPQNIKKMCTKYIKVKNLICYLHIYYMHSETLCCLLVSHTNIMFPCARRINIKYPNIEILSKS